MNQIVVDTDVASYIFNWHSLAQQYADALRGSELILSFMTIAETPAALTLMPFDRMISQMEADQHRADCGNVWEGTSTGWRQPTHMGSDAPIQQP